MLFNSLTFVVFFAIVLALYRLLPGAGARKGLLLGASYVFYAAWNPPYVLILWFSTLLDWTLARAIYKTHRPRRRRTLLMLSLASNLGLLAFFKYAQFLLDNTQHLLALAGLHYAAPALGIVLPIGISFYTFASLSYTIDVYRGHVRGDWRLIDYALFVSFFPHLVAGPIVRAAQLLPQIAALRQARRDELGWGLVLVVIGLAGKCVLADALFAPLVDAVYAKPDAYGALDAWAAVLAFAGQIYFDFAGYSLCAIGLALCFGVAFPDNFRFPYAAIGFSDFWRRWHISLSSWLRDYLYVPLGGNRHGRVRTYANLLVTMLLGGLWHGASWMFVLWGALHGAYLAAERAWRERRGTASRIPAPAAALVTFGVVALTWIPFRAGDPALAGALVRRLVAADAPALPTGQLAACFVAAAAMLWWQFTSRDSSLEARFAALGRTRQIAVLGACLIAIFLCSGGDERAFIYFQF
ncbi:MAG TPA: MBOAT family O-acyltransferase [Rudaea sp.]|nr:MBOAT family O-acyltransferase [Rudaea sp.]